MFKVEPYPDELKKLQTFKGFLEEFYHRIRTLDLTSEKTYESVENDHEKYFGHRKYSNYKSFRVMRGKKAKEK